MEVIRLTHTVDDQREYANRIEPNALALNNAVHDLRAISAILAACDMKAIVRGVQRLLEINDQRTFYDLRRFCDRAAPTVFYCYGFLCTTHYALVLLKW
ncbi:hypothetical protein GCK32_007473 [Trichostrongylus colubriformis]|uniref:Uncharacterized protein n=1 Tax=Trichostrongylus colubriformis TaxID=6319 RepID=A0AAN8EZ55_TRICO